MPVTLHQPVAGMETGTSYSGPMEDWLVAQGYASDGAPTDMVNLLDVTEDGNPTLAQHREDPLAQPTLFGTEVEVRDNAAELNALVARPDAVYVPAIGAEPDPEQDKLRASLDGRVGEVSKDLPSLQVAAVDKATEVAGTGDHLLTEPTDKIAAANAPGVVQEQPTPVAKAKAKAKRES